MHELGYSLEWQPGAGRRSRADNPGILDSVFLRPDPGGEADGPGSS